MIYKQNAIQYIKKNIRNFSTYKTLQKKLQTEPIKVFSGIQPTGIPHIGNYIGAQSVWKQIQDIESHRLVVERTRFQLEKIYGLKQFNEQHESIINHIKINNTDICKKIKEYTKNEEEDHITPTVYNINIAPPIEIEEYNNEKIWDKNIKILEELTNNKKLLYVNKPIFCIVDLHAQTNYKNNIYLKRKSIETFATLLSIGINENLSKIFIQSDIPEHSELCWLLQCCTPLSWQKRMTQFKDKSLKKETINCGLLSYPILMAADILLYKSTVVPVGEDQKQHIELCNEIIHRLRSIVDKDILPSIEEPTGLIYPNITRIMSLRDPTKKMSKSDPSQFSCILLNDTNDSIRTKIQRSISDNEIKIYYDKERRPGVSNLLNILSSIQSQKDLRNDIEQISYHLERDQTYRFIKNITTSTHIEPLLAQMYNEPIIYNNQLIQLYIILMTLIYRCYRCYQFDENYVNPIIDIDIQSTSELKEIVTNVLIEEIQPIRERIDNYQINPENITTLARQGASSVRSEASDVLQQYRRCFGVGT